ncbi:MAG: T9SS type A sorting domain-containing protein [Candidatus Cloacimonadota bacterium]|nr:T9SS type A sorting domain-containing protein [Candidatus Cloacimonadota bacterium]
MLYFTTNPDLWGKRLFVIPVLLMIFSINLGAKQSNETGNLIPKPVNTSEYQTPLKHTQSSNRGYEEWTGSGPWGGIVRDIVTAPDDGSIVLSACGFSMASSGSVWRSEDGGNTWEDTGLDHKPFYGLATSPSENGVFFAGGKYGFYKSNNYGEDWQLLSCSSTFILKIGVKINDGNTIITGLASSAGVRRSTDGGINWETVGINSGFLKGISTTPANPEKFVIAGSDFPSSAMQSLDGGENWTPIGPDSGGDITGYDVLISQTNENQILLLHDDGIYGTTDNGENWNLLKSGGGQGEFSVHDGNIYVGIWGQGVFVSTDNGNDWTHIPEAGIGNYWQTASSSDNGVLMGFWGGIKSCADLGEDWDFSDTGMCSPFTHALAYYADRDELWAGTEGGGVFRSLDQGETWNRMNNGLNNLWIYDFAPLSHQNHSVDRMVIATASGLYISDDYGENWILKDMEGSTLTDVEIHWTNPNRYWEAEQMGTIKYTANNGMTWISATGLPFGLYPKLAIGKNEDNMLRVFTCYENGYGTSVYYSDDNGATFSAGLGMSGISYHTGLSVRLPDNEYDQIVYCATGQGLYSSEDFGENWLHVSGTSGLYWSVVGTRGEEIFLGSSNGVQYSSDEGQNWTYLNEGISGVTVWRLLYGYNQDQIFAANRSEPVLNYWLQPPPPMNVQVNHTTGLVTWDNESAAEYVQSSPDYLSINNNRDIIGNNIYLDGEFIAEIFNQNFYQLENLIIGMEYTVGVSNFIISNTENRSESEIVEVTFIYIGLEPTPPIQNLAGTVSNYQNVHLTWDQPNVSDLLAYHNGNVVTKKKDRKKISEEIPADIRDLEGYNVYRDGDSLAYVSGATTTLYYDNTNLDSGIYTYSVEAVYTTAVSNPVSIGVEIELPPVENLEFYLSEPNGVLDWDEPSGDVVAGLNGFGFSAAILQTRELTGFNAYLDGEFEGTTTNTFYVLFDVAGNHTAGVTALYEGGYESEIEEVSWSVWWQIDPEIQFTTLNGNFPNPFSKSTKISFSLKNPSHVSLSVYNLKGQLVECLVNEDLEGNQRFEAIWDGTSNGKKLGNGIYYYKLTADGKTFLKKMILMK